ncbi:MAG: DUF3352 domain-containing protein, partial [Leptospirales bacterium]|nr:DUF3352 domain-containing protein [Leptospirales bacterium]
LLHLEKSSGINKYKSSIFDDVDRMNFTGGVDIYSLLFGGLTLRESFQLETILQFDSTVKDINPKSLNYINIKSQPFAKMLRNKEYKTYLIDKCVPDDFYYIHFNNLNKGLNFLKIINEKWRFLYSRFQVYSIDFMVKEKLMTQLALIDSQEFSSFYSNGVSEIVLTGSDPFIVEGSDVTLIININNNNQAIEKMRRDIKNLYSANEKKITISDYQGTHLYTDNRKVWSIIITLPNGIVLVSNSIKAAEKIIDTYEGKHPALTDASDYKYIRTIYPAGPENEDGFIYLSDKFMKYLVSPELRIKEARRIYEGIRLSVLEKYIIYYFQLTGKYPATIDEIVEAVGSISQSNHLKNELDFIKRNPLYNQATRFDQTTLSNWNSFRAALSNKSSKKKTKGESPGKDSFIYDMQLFYKKITGLPAYTPGEVMDMLQSISAKKIEAKKFTGLGIRENSFSAMSDVYGRIGFMIPIIDLDMGNISKREAEMYRDFAASYNNSRKEFFNPINIFNPIDIFNPIGIRIKTDPEFSIETCILPLKNNSLYTFFSSIIGGDPIDLYPDNKIKGDTLSMAFKINPKLVSDYLVDSKSNFKADDIFKDEIQFHMSDAVPLIDFDSEVYSYILKENISKSSETDSATLGLLSWALTHPIRLSLPVKKSNESMLFIESLINNIISSNRLSNLLTNESYTVNYNNHAVRVIKLKFYNILIKRLYLSEKDNTLHIATTEKYIKDVLDAKFETNTKGIKGNGVIIYRPSEMQIEKDTYINGITESGLEMSKKNFGTIKLLGLIAPNISNKDLPDFMYENFGFKPICPLGGEYIYDKNTGSVKNSIYGNQHSPNLKLNPNSSGIVQQYLKSLFESSELRVELKFTPEGIMTKIVDKK